MKQTHYPFRQKRTVVVASLHQTYEKNRKANTEMLTRAAMLLAKASDPNPEVVAFVHIEDKKGQEAFRRLRQPAYAVNGEYKEVLNNVVGQLIHEEMDELVVVGDEPDLAMLCTMVARNNGRVTIWSVDKTPTTLMRPEYRLRHVSELPLEGLGGTGQSVTVWIDLENVLFPLKQNGIRVSSQELVQVLQEALADLGNVVSMIAYADFKVLSREFGTDIQYDLEKIGVKTRFQINHRGKNSADMALTVDLQTSIELDPTIQTVVIVSGDRDLNPAIDAARQRGKKVIVVALEQSLSSQLRRNADEVRLLDGHLGQQAWKRQPTSLDHPLLPKLLQLAARMQANHWRWVYINRLHGILSADEVVALLSEGVLQPGRPQDTRSVAFNQENALARQIELAGLWIPGRVKYLIAEKKMPWVDTNFLARGMGLDSKCVQVGLGQDRQTAAIWLDAAAAAGLVVKREMPHPDNETKLLDTWWPPVEQHDTVVEESCVAPESAHQAQEGPQTPIHLMPNHSWSTTQSTAY